VVAVNGVYILRVLGTHQSQQHIHTLHFRSTSAAVAASATEGDFQQAIINDWQTNARTTYRGMFFTSSSPCQTYEVRKVCGSLPLPGGVDETEIAPNIVGSRSASGEAAAPWLAGVVTLRTAYAGRSYRGRNFIGGLGEQDFNGATMESAWITAVTAYYTALVASFVTPSEISIGAKLFVHSRRLADGDPTAVPPLAPRACQEAGGDVQSFVVRNQLATMKSRKAGSGL
jgi:hypothetical protein